MKIEIPIQLYELLLIAAAKTGSATGTPLTVEEIAEFCFKKYLEERNDDIAN